MDSAWSRAGVAARVRDHGYTILCLLAAVIAAIVLRSNLELESFRGRAIGVATLANFDVAARTAMFTKCVLVGAAVIALSMWALPRLQRRFGRELFDTLNTGAVGGALLAYMVLWGQIAPATFELCVAFLGLLVLVWAFDRLGLKSSRACDLGRDAVWIGSIAWCLAWVIPEFSDSAFAREHAGLWAAGWVLIGGSAVYMVRWLASRRRDVAIAVRFSDRLVYGASALAVIPFAMFFHREGFLILNGRGYTSLEPKLVQAVVFGTLAMWCVVRALRGPKHLLPNGRLDVERLLAWFVFPWIVVGYSACLLSAPTVQLSDDFFESGNSALFVQQFFDFGRVPFLETFNAHGLSDSLFAFIDRALVGHHQASWQLYNHWYSITAKLAIFHVLRIGLRGACPAMFAWLCLPYLDRLFHPVPVHGLILIFVVLWVARRTSTAAWAAFFGSLVAAFAWRLDIGYAGTIASIVTLVLLRITAENYRLPWRAIVRGAVVAGAVVLALLGGLAALRGVNLLHWFRDMAHVVSSNQGFGYMSIARELNSTVMWHLYGLPILMVLLCGWMVVRWRGRLQVVSPVGRVFVVCIFLAVFTLANYPRGLVRHSFLEGENAMTSAFTLGCLAFTPAWLFETARTRSILVGFVLISSILAFTFDLQGTTSRRPPIVTTRYERAPGALSTMWKLEASERPVDRAPMDDGWKARHIAGIQAFFDKQLEPQQTFFDLSSSPLLYFHLRRPSPQWLNHLLLVYDQYMQDRALQEWSRWDTPFLLMPAERDLALQNGVVAWDNIDGVEMRLRLYELFEHAYADYQPYGLVGRWPVWVRKDWLQLAPPRSPKHDSVFEWTPKGIDERERVLDADQGETTVEVGTDASVPIPLVEADRNSSLYLRIVAESDQGGSLDLRWTVGGPTTSSEDSRHLRCPTGRFERYYLLPTTRGSRHLDSLRLTSSTGVRIQTVELLRCVSRETTALPPRALSSVVSEWKELARLWGTYDPPSGPGYTTARTLYDWNDSLEPSYSMGLDQREDEQWERGIARNRAAVRLANPEDAGGVRIGDTIHFDAGDRRTVTRITGTDIELSGDPLPMSVAAESRMLLHPLRMAKLPITPTTRHRFAFEPIEQTERGTYLVLRLRSSETDAQDVLVDYGIKGESRGRFTFNARVDGQYHDYAIRLSTQFNWATQANLWISVVPSVGALELEYVRIVEENP